ncbi:unnamed protein product [Durusdinium trenchii]|uniref:Uncharacterized protein n=1 Tax=Durusdinium trenchii TaxID=1381693 RepID=A0ABP0H8D0_9DINO
MASSSLSHLPWGMIPAFKPGETDINEYTKRLEFLADLWPTEHLSHLAPRAAMLCEGGAFKRLMRVDAKKLKVNSLDGIKLLVSTLGGVWGKAKHEEKFERFERAIYSTVQRPDETHESYLARHDFQFEELAALRVTIDEMRAYCLLRNSGLLMDEKKKIIIDSDGQLEYGKVVAALKVLVSRFFTECQSSGKSSTRTKTYEAANVMEEDEPPSTLGDDDAVFPDHWYDDILLLSEENEQDALVIQQFEDSLVDVLQNDPETAQCFYSYLEARKRITERNKNRGFWPVKGSGKGKSKTKFGFSKGFGKSRRPLAQRILESECRRRGQKGHWKAECPRRFENEAKPTNAAFAGTVHAAGMLKESDDMILMCEVDEFVAALRHNLDRTAKEEFMRMTMEELGHQQITFGKEKKGLHYSEVVRDDPQYVAWFTSTYKNSDKTPHQKFIRYVQLYTEDLERRNKSDSTGTNTATPGAMSKSKAAPKTAAYPEPKEKTPIHHHAPLLGAKRGKC